MLTGSDQKPSSICSIPAEVGVLEERSSLNSIKHRLKTGKLGFTYLFMRNSRAHWRLAREFLYDFRRFGRFSSAINYGDSQPKLEGLIIMGYHSLEKGLSIKSPRPGFGQPHVRTLLARLERYLAHCPPNEHCQVAFNVLCAYAAFNREHQISLPWLEEQLTVLKTKLSRAEITCGGGVKRMTKSEFLAAAKRPLDSFFESRCSVRQYSPEPVSLEAIEHAVRLAQKAPSVCNRQSGRTWLINSRREVQDALAIQGGARGFSEEIGTVLVVTSELASFQSSGERYQCWIDGGLFAMSLIHALHSLGLVTCCLNWSKTRDTDVKFKNRFGIPHSESIILLLSVGHPIETFNVAQSSRRPMSEVLTIVTHAT